jgi:hypothetical protein
MPDPEVENLNPSDIPQETPDEPQVDPVLTGFEDLADKPSAAQVDQWKQIFGDVYLLALDADEMYVWRPLRRMEYKTLLQDTKNDEMIFEEQVVSKCVPWPKLGIEFNAASKAGTIKSLATAIMEGSNFMDPRVVLSLVRKL